jgi:hypothetical protein
VVPGKYRIIAIMGEDPENLKTEATIAATAGTPVELSEKESKSVTLYLYAAAHCHRGFSRTGQQRRCQSASMLDC